MKTSALILALGVFVSLQNVWAQTFSSNRPWLLTQGAAARESQRFTLQEWLENKDRRTMMDMWLTMHTPTPYEFVIGGSYQDYKLDTRSGGVEQSQSFRVLNSELTAYTTFVGVTFEYTNNREEHFNDLTGIFNLRLFGNTVQGSHLTLHYGLRTRTGDNGVYRLNQPFPGVTLQLYLMKFFGIQGNYRYYGNTSEPYFGDSTTDELTYGAFIEYGALRLFGDVYQERQNSKLNGVETDYNRSGTRIGLKLFF